MLFAYPKAAEFGRILPKSRIYQNTRVSNATKALFVREVDQIIWKYKLAPETTNLPATRKVSEIQVFWLTLKSERLDFEVLRTVDKAIPFPLIFEAHYRGKCRVVAAYKRPNEADSAKWVTGPYFESPWQDAAVPRNPLPVALNLASLYEAILSPLMPHAARGGETIEETVQRIEIIQAQKRTVTQIESRLKKEKQFNRRVAINAELRAAKQTLDALTGVDKSTDERR